MYMGEDSITDEKLYSDIKSYLYNHDSPSDILNTSLFNVFDKIYGKIFSEVICTEVTLQLEERLTLNFHKIGLIHRDYVFYYHEKHTKNYRVFDSETFNVSEVRFNGSSKTLSHLKLFDLKFKVQDELGLENFFLKHTGDIQIPTSLCINSSVSNNEELHNLLKKYGIEPWK